MQSAAVHKEVVSAYLAEEANAGSVVLAGTTKQAEAIGIHHSPFRVIPKKNKPGKFRLILNLSAPEGVSVHDRIVKELADTAARLGRGDSWQKWTLSKCSTRCRYTCRTDHCWACCGKTKCSH